MKHLRHQSLFQVFSIFVVEWHFNPTTRSSVSLAFLRFLTGILPFIGPRNENNQCNIL